MRGPRTVAAVSAAGVAMVLCGSTGAHVQGTSKRLPCTVLVARDRILSASTLPKSVKDNAAGMNGGGVDRIICKDVTQDGRSDMTVLVASAGKAKVTAWVVFRAKAHWNLVFDRTNLYQASVRVKKGDLIEVRPVKRHYQHRRYHWKKKHFILLYEWDTKSP